MLGFPLARAAVEMIGAKVLVMGAVLQHMIDRGEHRGGDGADGFLRSALGSEPSELRPVIAVFLARGCPGALDEDGLEPGRAFAQARGLALAGALVLARIHPCPCHQVSSGWKMTHPSADF